jgi:type IV secretion system T-DNA border endonuclease VirD2
MAAQRRISWRWDLDIDFHRRRADLDARGGGSKKLVHKLLFSMLAGSPPNKVFAAAKNFAREEFDSKHRYATVLHTDEPHPHVHMVVKAVSEDEERLHIRKTALRTWRAEFARHLRMVEVSANATPRYFRGETSPRQLDGAYRANRRGASTQTRGRAELLALKLAAGELSPEPAKAKPLNTRKEVGRAWQAIGRILIREGQPDLAKTVQEFADHIYPAADD